MSIPKYIEFDSTYRNRVLYPYPAQFTISMANQKTNSLNALDPVVLSAPIFSWSSNAFQVQATTGSISNLSPEILGKVEQPLPSSSIISNTTDNSILILNSNTGKYFQQYKDYYVGACLNLNNTISGITGSNTRRIVKYNYLGPTGSIDRCAVTVNQPFQDSLNLETTNPTNFSITDPSDFYNPSYPLLFIPDGLSQANSYIDYFIYNETKNQSNQILYYDEITHIALLKPFNPSWSWSTTDSFSLRKKLPESVVGLTTGISTLNYVTISGGSPVTGAYDNKWLRILPKDGKYYYQNNYPINFPDVYENTPYLGPTDAYSEIVQIKSYDGTSKIAYLNKPLYYVPQSGCNLEILNFSYDNVYPFLYTGKDREASNYKIELVNLILPNITLNSGYGARIAYYPYVYVKLKNVSAPFGGTNKLIISNNPNATSMVFRCPINDVNHPQNSPFIKLDGNGMSQIFCFTAYDDLSFEVLLPNGDLYKTIEQDYYSPLEPNYQVQITAVFRFEKL